jgi:MFS family permease
MLSTLINPLRFTGVMSGIIDSNSFEQHFNSPSAWEKGLLVAVVQAGAMVGAPGGGLMADSMGRRTALVFAAVLFGAGGVLMALSSHLNLFLCARFGSGIGIGIASTVVPMFLAEISPSTIRGSLVACYQILICVGIMVAYGIDAVYSEQANGWRVPLGGMVVPAVIMACGMVLVPETPRFFLLKQGPTGVDRALRSLGRLRYATAPEDNSGSSTDNRTRNKRTAAKLRQEQEEEQEEEQEQEERGGEAGGGARSEE